MVLSCGIMHFREAPHHSNPRYLTQTLPSQQTEQISKPLTVSRDNLNEMSDHFTTDHFQYFFRRLVTSNN